MFLLLILLFSSLITAELTAGDGIIIRHRSYSSNGTSRFLYLSKIHNDIKLTPLLSHHDSQEQIFDLYGGIRRHHFSLKPLDSFPYMRITGKNITLGPFDVRSSVFKFVKRPSQRYNILAYFDGKKYALAVDPEQGNLLLHLLSDIQHLEVNSYNQYEFDVLKVFQIDMEDFDEDFDTFYDVTLDSMRPNNLVPRERASTRNSLMNMFRGFSAVMQSVAKPRRHAVPFFVRKQSIGNDALDELETYFYLVERFKKMKSHLNYDLKVTIENQEGVDLGGLTRTMLEEAALLFVNDPALFTTITCGSEIKTRLYAKKEVDIALSEKLMVFGIILGMMFANQVPLPVVMVDSFYNRLVNDNRNSMADYSCYQSLLKIKSSYLHEDEDSTTFQFNENSIDKDYKKFLVYKNTIENNIMWKIIHYGFENVVGRNFNVGGDVVMSILKPLNEIPLREWKSVSQYIGYNAKSKVVDWFWKFLSESNENRSKVLKFALGLSHMSELGFEGRRFTIQRISGQNKPLPIGHTCAFQLDLPEYESEELFREKIIKAIEYTGDEFHSI